MPPVERRATAVSAGLRIGLTRPEAVMAKNNRQGITAWTIGGRNNSVVCRAHKGTVSHKLSFLLVMN
jgi:hypothetical protein